MTLSRKTLENIDAALPGAPAENYFHLPEKVLQFGTGVLLRGLTDFFIDKANKQGLFNGRIVVVKSTGGDVDSFEKQNGLYTICVRGIDNGKKIEENIINASISRVLSAKNNWEEILKCASNPEMQVIISNTTEVGIVLVKDDIHAKPPQSFPGKLLAFLYKRYQVFNGDADRGMVIIPTELIPDNGNKLLSIVTELARQNNLENSFINWLQQSNYFCSSLVDRIVPGKLPDPQQQEMETMLGYTDDLMIMCEVYRLWAIESGNEKVKQILSFGEADEGVVIAPDITIFRELKLRLLNGSHTLSCGLAHLSGFTTVKEAMNNEAFANFIQSLMLEEIAPAIITNQLLPETAKTFAGKVLERYSNPYLEHKWLSITLQYSSKMAMRVVPVIVNYIQRFGDVPSRIAFGFAAHILFMRPIPAAEEKYYGELHGKKYFINDSNAAFYAGVWHNSNINDVAKHVLANKEIWGRDLSQLNGFTNAVASQLSLLMKQDVYETLKQYV